MPGGGDGSVKLLIAAGEAASELGELPAGVRAVIDQADEILVVAPTLPDRLAWLVSDTDKTRQVADARLHQVLGQLKDADKEAGGVVGSDDPLVAFDDAIADFGPQHILIALRGSAEAGWQERSLVEEVVSRFGLPVTVFTLDR
jgi:hypothetical protein